MGAEVMRAAFAGQAAAFEDPASGFGEASLLDWIVSAMPTTPDDVALEVAAGTGWIARALAPLVRAVVATDVTPEMLAAGKGSAPRNVVFQEADARALPFLDDSFDRVACRLAVHHVVEHGALLAEMVRVCRPGGTVLVIDMVAPDGPLGDVLNALERLRDHTHARALTRTELRDEVERAGARVVREAERARSLSLERWLAQTSTPADRAARVRAAIEDELHGGTPTGLEPRRDGGDIAFVHHWRLIVAEVQSSNAGSRFSK